MRRAAPALVVLVAALALSHPPGAAAFDCQAAQGHTRAAKGTARVYYTGEPWGAVTFGCVRGGKRIKLDGEGDVMADGLVALAGTKVAVTQQAWGSVDEGISCTYEVIAVIDLRDGRRRMALPDSGECLQEPYPATVRLFVRPGGSAAWSDIHGDVYASPAGAEEPRRLGSKAKPRTLRLHGSTLTWRGRAGHRSALLH